MSGSLLRDRIILGIQSEDARKRLLQMDWCLPNFRERDNSPPAIGEVVSRVDRRAGDHSKKNRKRGEGTETLFEGKNT